MNKARLVALALEPLNPIETAQLPSHIDPAEPSP